MGLKQEKLKIMNRKGFSLVEVLVALGVMGIMSLALITSIENSRKAVKSLEIKLELIDFSTAFKNQISSNANCVATFSATRILPLELVVGSSIDIPPSEILFQGNLLSTYNFQAFDSTTSTVKFVVTAVPAAGSANGNLRFNLNPKAQFSSYMKNKEPTIPFSISVSGGGVITSCPGGASGGTPIKESGSWVAAGGETFVTINFTQAYATPPIVIVSPYSNLLGIIPTKSEEPASANVSIINVTKTNFRMDPDLLDSDGNIMKGGMPAGFRVNYIVVEP